MKNIERERQRLLAECQRRRARRWELLSDRLTCDG
jgi:hypothetical protein